MASYTPNVKEILRAHGCHVDRPDHETAFPRGRESPVAAHRQRGTETSRYREANLTCACDMHAQSGILSFQCGAIAGAGRRTDGYGAGRLRYVDFFLSVYSRTAEGPRQLFFVGKALRRRETTT